jgi:hypothetical protein
MAASIIWSCVEAVRRGAASVLLVVAKAAPVAASDRARTHFIALVSIASAELVLRAG